MCFSVIVGNIEYTVKKILITELFYILIKNKELYFMLYQKMEK